MSTLSPTLPHVPATALSKISLPTLKIRTDEDVTQWKLTSGYKAYGLFLRRLNESVVGYELPLQDEFVDNEFANRYQPIIEIMTLLDELDSWIDDIPPQPTPQRFGNLAFRDYGARLEERASGLLKKLLPLSLHEAVPLLSPYLLSSFGSFQRIDYGSGHETSFLVFLYCLAVLRFFNPEPSEERRVVLRVFERYIRLVWKLQDVYRLEPAGSHGVWGLDDYSFLPYYFGSGQLRDRDDLSPSCILKPPLPPTNLYYTSIMRIHRLKHGPFHEHSSQLYSIAQGVQRWSKVNSGMLKMYEAEVLGKRVVVQHLPLGGLLPWDVPPPSNQDLSSPIAFGSLRSQRNPMTTAPWASGTKPHLPSGVFRS